MTSILAPTNRMNVGRIKIKPIVVQRWPTVEMDLYFEVFSSIHCCHTTQCLVPRVDHFQFFADFEEQLRWLRPKKKIVNVASIFVHRTCTIF